uniref:Uncharacterized protein n=1 Tax=Mycena chlorophos TaxID=658473 RepID=A0ABQ0L476_MYCCL|nr:predicted protein [Mycena chlorophos]
MSGLKIKILAARQTDTSIKVWPSAVPSRLPRSIAAHRRAGVADEESSRRGRSGSPGPSRHRHSRSRSPRERGRSRTVLRRSPIPRPKLPSIAPEESASQTGMEVEDIPALPPRTRSRSPLRRIPGQPPRRPTPTPPPQQDHSRSPGRFRSRSPDHPRSHSPVRRVPGQPPRRPTATPPPPPRDHSRSRSPVRCVPGARVQRERSPRQVSQGGVSGGSRPTSLHPEDVELPVSRPQSRLPSLPPPHSRSSSLPSVSLQNMQAKQSSTGSHQDRSPVHSLPGSTTRSPHAGPSSYHHSSHAGPRPTPSHHEKSPPPRQSPTHSPSPGPSRRKRDDDAAYKSWKKKDARHRKSQARSKSKPVTEREHTRYNPHHIPTKGKGALSDKDAKLLKGAWLHFQIMCGIEHGNQALAVATPADLAAFEAQFVSPEAWRQKLQSLKYSDERGMDKVRELRSADRLRKGRRGAIASAVVKMKDPFLATIFSTILEAGLPRFLPDVLGSPESLYNLVHEDLALESFERVAVRHAYDNVGADITNLRNRALTRRMYRHFVFYHIYDKAQRVVKNPHALVERVELTNMYKRRIQDADRCDKFLRKDGWPEVTRRMLKYPECNSEDESNGNGTFTRIPVELRSVVGTQFKRSIEKRIIREARAQNQFSFAFHAPIDWFDPEAYNAFSARTRDIISRTGVALPAEQHWQEDEDGDLFVPDYFKTMSAEEFNEYYAPEVLAAYNIPTEEELLNAEADSDAEGDDEGDEESDE